MSAAWKQPLNAIFQVFLILTLLLGAVTPSATVEASSENRYIDQNAGNDISAGITLGANPSFSNEQVPILSEEIAKQAQEQPDQPLQIDLSAEPAMYTPGKPILIKWELTGGGAEQRKGLSIVARPPDGILPVNTKDTLNADGSVLISPKADKGTIVWKVLDYAELPLTFTFELVSNGEILNYNAILIGQPLATTSRGQNSKITSRDGKVKVTIPANANTAALLMDIRSPSPHALHGASLSWNPVEIIAVDRNSQKNVTKFSNPITIQINYDESEIFGWDERDLSIFYYDPHLRDWFPMETAVDAKSNTLTAQSDHLTVFDYKANNWQSQMLPTVDAYKTADFTGAATYQIDMWTPPAPGGLQPAVILSYNSQIIDESSAYSQASWAGMGWDLDTGAVTRNMHGTDTDLSDDTYSISIGGASMLLLPISANGNIVNYNTADQSFMKVESHDYDPSDPDSYSFIAWTKDGTRYDFKETIDVRKSSANCNSITWRWSLSKVTDIHGNTLNFTYFTETKNDGCNSEIAVYPATITYGNGKYRVNFIREARTDFQTSWTTAASRTLYGTNRLKEAQIQHNNGAWTNVKRYVMSYAPNNTTNIYPNFNFSNGGKTLTLVGVQEFGADGSALPAVTFTYADSMHLTTVNNGQGGSVTMAYSAWQYLDDVNTDLRVVKTHFQTEDCVNGPGPSPTWGQVSGRVRCDASKLLQVGNIPATASIAERSIPEHMIKPSANYSFIINVRAIQNTTNVGWGIRDTATNQTTMLAASGINTTGGIQNRTLTMPVTYNPANTRLRLDCSNCFFRSFEFTQHVILYRVASHTVTIQPSGLSSTYAYQYDNASPATNDNSAAVAAVGTNLSALYFKKLREFRGHAMSQVTNPQGLTTVNWFWQADGLKGRAYNTLIMQRTFFDSLESLNANWVASGGVHTAAMESQKDFDNSIKSVNGSANWNVSLSRASASVSDGRMAVAHIRLTGANAQGEVGLVNGASFVGLTLSSSGAVASSGASVLSPANFIRDEWYGVALFVDANDQARVRIWQLDNPNNFGEASLPSMGGAWTFRTRVNNGTIYTDTYFEGVPYSETITRHQGVAQYDTIAANGIPDIAGLLTFKDLAVTWVRTNSVENRNYNGDAAFVGTKQDFTYASTYGNLLSQVESGNSGGGWAAYRKTNFEYYPNATAPKYIVGLPGRQTLTDAGNALLAETLYFYDNAAAYTTPPAKGNLTTQRNWAGGANYAQTSMTYDAFGNRLTQSAHTEYGTAASNPPASSRQTTTTVYDAAGYNTYPTAAANPLNQTVSTTYNYALGLPVSETDANGVTTSATYDGFGRMKTITAPGDSSPTLQVNYFDASIPFKIDLIQTVSAASAIRLSRFYDGAGRLIQTQTANAVINPSTSSGQAASLQNVVVDSQYNNLGQLVRQTTPYVVGANSAPAFVSQTFTQPSTQTTYDAIGRALSATAPNTTSVTYAYTDLTTTARDPNLNSTATTRDVWGRVTLVDAPTGPDVSYAYDVSNRLTHATRGGATTQINYDILGRKTGMSDPDMGYWSYTYDALGNLKSQTDAKNQTTCLYYDALNRLDGKIYSSSGGCGAPLNFNVDFNYDAGTNGIGRRSSMSDASGSTTWTYDTRGRLSTETKVISAQSFVTAWNYNTGDLPVAMTYPDGETLTYGYNPDSTLKTVNSSTGGAYLNDMQYDEAGRLKLMQYGSSIINKTFNYFAWNTANMGGLLSSVSATGAAPLQNLAYTYDKNGNLLTIVDALAGPQTQTFTYDALDRITSASAIGGSAGLYSESYAYDSASGNLSLKNGVTYTYGDPAHIHAATSLSNGNSYVYDANGNMTQRNVSGQVFDLVYDKENRLTNVNAQGIQIIPSPTPTLPATATPTFTQTATITATATVTSTATETLTPTNTSTVTNTPTETLTATAIASPSGTEVIPPTETQTPTETYTPDPLVTPTDTSTPTETATPSETPTETLTPADTSTPIASPSGTETALPTFTSTATATATSSPTATLTFTPSLTATATLPPAVTFANATFTYNGDGQRVKSVIQTNYASATTYFVGNHYEVTSGVVTKYYYAGSQRIAMRKNGVLNYIIGDHLGSTSLVTDSSGVVINQTQYKAWGETRYVSGSEVTNYQYTGQYSYESDFGLYFYNARFYDPALGRFTSPDSIIPEQSQGVQAWDRYAYVSNNPVRYTDPTGHCPVCMVLVGAFFIFNGTSDSYQPNLSSEELQSRETSVNLGVAITTTALAIKSPVVEFLSNLYDCGTGGYCSPESLAIPGSASAYGDIPQTTTMSARNIRWTQDTATWTTGKGIALDQLAEDMAGNGWKGDPLRVVKFENKVWSLDNRRLAAAKLVDIDVPVKLYNTPAHPEIKNIWRHHFTTSTFGLNVNIVEKKGGPSLGISIRMNGSVRFSIPR